MAQVPKERIPEAVPVEAIRKIEKERNGTIAQASSLLVQSQSDSDLANVYLRKLTAALKMVNARFTEIMKPQNEALRQIRALKAEILTPLENAKTELSGRLMSWRREEQERIAKEREEAEAKRREREELEEKHRENGHKPPGPEPIIEEPTPLAMTDTTQVRNVWDFEVVDKATVPEEFKDVNTGRIRRAMQAAPKDKDKNPQIEILGVRFFQKEVPVYA